MLDITPSLIVQVRTAIAEHSEVALEILLFMVAYALWKPYRTSIQKPDDSAVRCIFTET